MKIRGSQLIALGILAGIGGWMFTGDLVVGGQGNSQTPTIAQREEAKAAAAFRVRVQTLMPEERPNQLAVRGRTAANTVVTVRAETGGVVEKRPVRKGQSVKVGDLLCVIEKGVRSTTLAQAQSTLRQAQEDYTSTEQLVKRGFATKSRLRGLRSALDSAKAALAQAEQDIGRTEIRATVAGVIREPMAQVGDNLAPGGVCVTKMDTNPMLFTGQVSERDINAVKLGMEAIVTPISGAARPGKVTYISPLADPNTRTFNIEVEVDNSESTLLDGMTAAAVVTLPSTTAFKVAPSWLTLADDGRIGIRYVGDGNKVGFQPIDILAQEADAMWVTGLEAGSRVITLGQNFVAAGELVAPVTPEQMKQLEAERAKQNAKAGAKGTSDPEANKKARAPSSDRNAEQS
ncbi:MAG: efflux RND transporter periplasmic adaptor subunit [Pseudomonadota bacterium]